jgi:hypothetical protein
MALTGHPDGPPLVPPGDAASLAGRVAGRLAAATEDTRHPVRVDGPALLGERAAFTGRGRRGPVSVGGACRLLPTMDGWAAVSCARPDDPLLLGALVGAELPEDIWPTVASWLRAHSGAELAERAALLGLAAAPVGGQPADGLAAATGLDVADRLAVAEGQPATRGRAATMEPPTTPGQVATRRHATDSRQATGGQPDAGKPEADGRAQAVTHAVPGRPRAVAGLLVVDFSALWAGPLCAHLLGLAGARVVKVETPQRLDGARRGSPGFYRLLHAGHRSVLLDPTTPAGRRALAALVDAADIVIEASRPRALAGFGLDARASVDRGAVWVSITAAGRAAPRVGFGDDVAAGAGLVALGRKAEPVFCGDALADPLTGLVAAELALSAPGNGRGQLFDVAMSDVVAATLTAPSGSPAPAARPAGTGWMVETSTGQVAVAPPRHRTATGSAPEPGEHTAEVLRSLRIPVP